MHYIFKHGVSIQILFNVLECEFVVKDTHVGYILLSSKTSNSVNKLTGNVSSDLKYGQLAPTPCYKSCGEHQ